MKNRMRIPEIQTLKTTLNFGKKYKLYLHLAK